MSVRSRKRKEKRIRDRLTVLFWADQRCPRCGCQMTLKRHSQNAAILYHEDALICLICVQHLRGQERIKGPARRPDHFRLTIEPGPCFSLYRHEEPTAA